MLCSYMNRPSSRVATAERKLKLVNDAAAKRFTTKSVVCAHCKETVALEGEGDYNLAKWDDHKASCARYVVCGNRQALSDVPPA